MMKLMVLFGVIAAISGAPTNSVEWEGRIVGGSTASAGQFPFIASLRTTGNSHFCGGSIMNNRWVVSAAHCTVGRTGANTRVSIGSNHINGGTRLGVSRIYNHPEYNSDSQANDISLVRTSTAIVYSPTVQPIKLGVENLAGDQQSTAIGWGETSKIGTLTTYLQFVTKTIISNYDCQEILGQVDDGQICTLEGVGIGTCTGDSGGPLVFNNALHGVVSFGPTCGNGDPDVYARVSFYNAWILGVTGPL